MDVPKLEMGSIPAMPLVYRHRLNGDWYTEFVGESVEVLTGYSAQEFTADFSLEQQADLGLDKGPKTHIKSLVKKRINGNKLDTKTRTQNLITCHQLAPKKHSLINLIHPDDWDDYHQILTSPEFTGSDNIYRLEYRIVTKDGQIRLVYDRGLKVFRNGHLVLLTGVLFDLSCAVEPSRPLPEEGLWMRATSSDHCGASHHTRQEMLPRHSDAPQPNSPSKPKFVEPSIRAVVSQLQLIQEQIERSNTDLAIAHLALAAQQKRYHELFDFAPDGYLVTDPTGMIYEANLALAQLLQSDQSDILGESFHIFVTPSEQAAFLQHWQQLMANPMGGNTFEVTLQPSHGVSFAAELTVGAIRDDEQELIGYRLLVRNIAERKKAEVDMHLLNQQLQQRVKQQTASLKRANQELVKLAFVDALTKVANRHRFDEQLQQEWRRMQRQGDPLTIIMCDVDHFKRYNDLYGHLLGDHCLRQVAQALQASVGRPGDLVARFGGEEFVLILPATDTQGAAQVVEKMRTHIHALDMINGEDLLTLSFGMATVIPSQERLPEQLVAAADQALYFAKQTGRDRYAVRELEELAERKA
jgi:diguanylate cyclase (GGDEF)-like protein/PAS domain S-box-containing protein